MNTSTRSASPLIALSALLMLSFAWTVHTPSAGADDMQLTYTATQSVQALAGGEWLLEATVDALGQSATGRVTLALPQEPDPESPPHLELARSLAWLSMGGAFLASGDFSNAVETARAGLEALGTRYVSPLATDDTDLKVKAAEMQIAEGKMENGAKVLLDMLQQRTQMYMELNESQVVR